MEAYGDTRTSQRALRAQDLLSNNENMSRSSVLEAVLPQRPGSSLNWGGRRWLTVVLVGVVAVAVPWIWSIVGSLPHLSRLPPESRKALYARTLSDLELCTGPGGRLLAAHCDHQAEFILNFEECDNACKSLSARWRGVIPTK